MQTVPSHLIAWRAFAFSALLVIPTACGSADAEVVDALRQELAAAHQQVTTLEAQLEQHGVRADAYRLLEFLGEQPVATGALTRFKIVAAPAVPDPQASDYVDCTAVWLCEPHGGSEQAQPERMLVVATVFHDRERTAAANLGIGSMVEAQLVPWEEMPEAARSIQRVDENDEFELPMFAALAPASQAVREVVQVTAPDGNGPSQEASIQDSIAILKARLAPHGTFAKWHAELGPVRTELLQQLEQQRPLEKDRRFVVRNLSYIQHPPNEQWPGPQIAYFVNLRDQLAAMGVDLIVVPFPEQEQVAALQFLANPPSDGVMDAYREQWYLSLLEAGVEVVDLRPALQAAVGEYQHVYYDAVDGHPANGAIVTAAREIAPRLRRYDDLSPTYHTLASKQLAYSIPTRQTKFPPHAHAEKCYTATVVMQADGNAVPLDVPGASILLVGDSFMYVPQWYGVPNADVGSQLIKETGVAIRRIGRGGGAPQLMVQMADAGRQLTKGVRVVIYTFREEYMFQHSPAEPKFRWQVVELPK